MAGSMKMVIFWVNAPCSLVVYRRFRDAYCPIIKTISDRPVDAGSKHVYTVGKLPDYTT
jgi:hypothetical protein